MNIVYRTLKHHFGIIGTVKSICVSYDSLKTVKDFFFGDSFEMVVNSRMFFKLKRCFKKKKNFFHLLTKESAVLFTYFYQVYSTGLIRLGLPGPSSKLENSID